MPTDRPGVVVAISTTDGRPTVVVAVSEAGRAHGLRAGELVVAATRALGGRGGGKDDVAQGGGAPLGDHADEQIFAAMNAVRALIQDKMGSGAVR
jgi:alanyl-tRNA synthetase